jgi:hypothetical protein
MRLQVNLADEGNQRRTKVARKASRQYAPADKLQRQGRDL